MCNSCEAMMINGVLCHEPGCPDAWHGSTIECKNCGNQFQPDNKFQEFCSEGCCNEYNGLGFDFQDESW